LIFLKAFTAHPYFPVIEVNKGRVPKRSVRVLEWDCVAVLRVCVSRVVWSCYLLLLTIIWQHRSQCRSLSRIFMMAQILSGKDIARWVDRLASDFAPHLVNALPHVRLGLGLVTVFMRYGAKTRPDDHVQWSFVNVNFPTHWRTVGVNVGYFPSIRTESSVHTCAVFRTY